MVGTLALLGVPKRAKDIEYGIKSALKVAKENNHERPFIISGRPAYQTNKNITNKQIMMFTFWSKWIPINYWEKSENLPGILSTLGFTKDVYYEIKNGGKNEDKPHIIVITIDTSKKSDDKRPPTDPLF